MKKHSGLGWNLLALTVCGLGAAACDDGSSGRNMDPDAMASSTVTGSATMPEQTGTGTTSNTNPTGTDTTNTPAPSTGGMGGAGGMGGEVVDSAGGAGGTMTDPDLPVCELPTSLTPFTRSDTEAAWDDNDFSDVTVEGTCPMLVNVTWPHEEGWEDADPADANFEQTHFTLDSYYSMDLTNKMLSATIELTDDMRGPAATTGGYIVSLVSVSNYTYEVIQEPAVEDDDMVTDAGYTDGGVLDSSTDATMVPPSEAGLADGGLDAGSATADEPMVVVETGYVEAETLPEDRIVLRHVGDRATVMLPLPHNTDAVDSYDPTRVIKINIRIYNMHVDAPMLSEQEEDAMLDDEMEAMRDAGMMIDVTSDAGVMSDAGMMSNLGVTPSGLTLDAGMSEMSDADVMSDAIEAGIGDAGTVSGPASDPSRVYDYITSQFAITSFKVVDAP